MTQKASAANPDPQPPYILALDVGTSSTRTLLVDATGNMLPNVLAQRPYHLTISNEGEVSVDPDALVAVVHQTIDDALEMAGPLAQHIGAVAIDTFWHGLLGVDADNHPLTALILFISGERSPGWHASARMTISGIQAHLSPADLLRAGMEALAYQLAAVYDQVCQTLQIAKTTPRIIGSGGALLGSMTLGQIVADTLGVPVYPSLDHEASARGAALLALEAIGLLPDVAQVPPHLQPSVKPDAQKHTVYRKGAERQQKLYQALLEEKPGYFP
jgi:gluconokinase